VGIGKRWPLAPLHEDTIAAGKAPPPGITIYGWALQAMTNYPWIWEAPWATLPEFDPQPARLIHNRFSNAGYEYLVEHPGIIMSQEFTVQQSIATTAAMWLYLAVRPLSLEDQGGL